MPSTPPTRRFRLPSLSPLLSTPYRDTIAPSACRPSPTITSLVRPLGLGFCRINLGNDAHTLTMTFSTNYKKHGGFL
jgi:hypothetical protein